MAFSPIFLVTVFLAGILSFFSPCVFPLLPVYLGILLDQDAKSVRVIFGKRINWSGIVKTLAFVAGLSTVFVTLGYGVGFLGKVLYTDWFRYLLGSLIVLMGLHQMEVINISPLQSQKSFQYKEKHGAIFNAFLLGLTFSFAWTPCIGPVLGSVLGLAASGGQGALAGGLYMIFYSLGMALPFLLLALASSLVMQAFNKVKPHLSLLKKIGGLLILIMGILVFTNSVNSITAFFENLFRSFNR